MMRLIVTRTAFKDIAEIWNFIATDSIDAADQVRDDLEIAMRKLADFPRMGHERADVKNPSYRFWRVHSYLIAYRVHGQALYVSRVLHGARNFRKLFRKPHRRK